MPSFGHSFDISGSRPRSQRKKEESELGVSRGIPNDYSTNLNEAPALPEPTVETELSATILRETDLALANPMFRAFIESRAAAQP